MIEAESLLRWLDARPAAGQIVAVGWRLDIIQRQTLRAGVRASRVGGPYEAPGLASSLTGSLDLHWSDGRLTAMRLDRAQIQGPEGALSGWRAEATSPARLPPIAGPSSPPDVSVLDPHLARGILQQPRDLLELVRPDREARRLLRGRRLDASLRASAGRCLVATSAGFRCSWGETTLSLEVWIDDAAGASFARRRLPTSSELTALYGDTIALAPSLQRDTSLPSSSRGVLFMPPAVEAALDHFVPVSLSVRAMRDGRSSFRWDDLLQRRAILAEHLDLIVDTTLPFALSTAPCTSSGIPAGRVALVEAGRLTSPLVDPALSRELGLSPTPSPRAAPRYLLQSSLPAESVASALDALGDGAIVRDLPGLHTQRRGRWSYALTVPDAQVIVGGAVAGRCAVRIVGSLLDHLRSPSTRLVSVPGQWNPGLLVLDGIRIEPA